MTCCSHLRKLDGVRVIWTVLCDVIGGAVIFAFILFKFNVCSACVTRCQLVGTSSQQSQTLDSGEDWSCSSKYVDDILLIAFIPKPRAESHVPFLEREYAPEPALSIRLIPDQTLDRPQRAQQHSITTRSTLRIPIFKAYVHMG